MVDRKPDMLRVHAFHPAAMIALRLDPQDEAAMKRIQEVLGMALPRCAGWTAAGDVAVLVLAFDEWLLLVSGDGRPELIGQLVSALAGCRAAVVDVSDMRTGFELRGDHARDVLRKGCAVDLHPRAFATGHCVQTALARVRVILRQLDDAPSYELLVERSYAAYLKDWLDDAAREFTAA